MESVQLGRVQFQIMRVLWDLRRANARDITETLNQTEPIAHSTVQTLLRQLEAKGAVGHEVLDRTFVFFPKLDEENVKRMATRDLLRRVYGGSAGELVAHLLKNERLTQSELNQLRLLIDRKRKDEQEAKP
jgi:BlaI family penicillinase repressor